MESMIESIKTLWTIAMWIRGAYVRVRRVLPFLTLNFIMKAYTARWFFHRFVLPKYGGTYSGTYHALAPQVEQAVKFVVGGNVLSALQEAAQRAAVALQELQAPESKAGARMSTVLAVVAALAARELLGMLVRVIMSPDTKESKRT